MSRASTVETRKPVRPSTRSASPCTSSNGIRPRVGCVNRWSAYASANRICPSSMTSAHRWSPCQPRRLSRRQAPPSQPLPGGTPAPDDLTAYLLGTIVARLRHAGLTVGQSCALVDRVLHCCFGRPDPLGTRAAVLAEQWRRLNQHASGA